jgi:universal stress protein A
MFKKILMPVDLADKHQHAVDTALWMARHDDAEVLLLHVVETIEGMSEDDELYDKLEATSREYLKAFSEQFARAGVRSRWEIAFGTDSAEILRFAAENEVDLIVLTSPKFDPQSPQTAAGSLSWKIGVVSPCPVLLLK